MQTPVLLRVPKLDTLAFAHGFSTSALGSVGLTHAPDPVPVLASRRAFARAAGIGDQPLTTLGAVHGSTVARVDEPKDVVQGAAALSTTSKGAAPFARDAD